MKRRTFLTAATAAMAAAIEEMTISSNQISERAHETEDDSRAAMETASDGAQRVTAASGAIGAIAMHVLESKNNFVGLDFFLGEY